jgi:predicted RNase H-like HicB family nuclease/AraC-like DNA-binding protein
LADGLEAAEDRVVLAGALERLDERERRMVYLRFVRDLPQEQVARELGISRRHLSRQTEAALAKLRLAIEEGRGPLPRPAGAHKMAPMGVGPSPVESEYLERPYHIAIARDEDQGWTARVEELRGCEARGATYEEAARGIRVAMEEWISDAVAKGREVPPPRAPASHSGKLMLRMPQSLHAELARAAERDEVSLNQFITSSLASTVGWGDSVSASDEDEGAPAGAWVRRAMLANLVVLCLAGTAAVALLVVALTHGF